MGNGKFFVILSSVILVLIVINAFMKCRKGETTTTTTTTVNVVQPADTSIQVPSPDPVEVEDFDLLIAKGVQVDSLREILRHVASRYEYYKAEATELRRQIEALQPLLSGSDCDERELVWKQQVEKLKGRNEQLDNLIDSLFVGISDARKVNSYSFNEQDDYQSRTTEVTVSGHILPGGYQVSKRYFIPTTTTTKVSTEKQRRHSFGLLLGVQLSADQAQPIYLAQYRRGGRLGILGQLGYIPADAAVQPAVGLSVNF